VKDVAPGGCDAKECLVTWTGKAPRPGDKKILGGCPTALVLAAVALLLSACGSSGNGSSSGAAGQPLETAMADSALADRELATAAPQQPVVYCKVLRINGQLAKDVVTRQIRPGCVPGTNNGLKMTSVFFRGSPGAPATWKDAQSPGLLLSAHVYRAAIPLKNMQYLDRTNLPASVTRVETGSEQKLSNGHTFVQMLTKSVNPSLPYMSVCVDAIKTVLGHPSFQLTMCRFLAANADDGAIRNKLRNIAYNDLPQVNAAQ
jgi:hypothetical protein